MGESNLVSPSLSVEVGVSSELGPGVWLHRSNGFYDGERFFVGVREIGSLVSSLCKIGADWRAAGSGKGRRPAMLEEGK